MQSHLGGDPFQGLHLEVGVAHPELDGAERMLDRLAALAHLLRMLIKAALDGFKQLFMFPAGNSAVFVGGAEMLYRAALAGICPVAA